MKSDRMQRELEAMAAMHGVIGCAVIDTDGGMAWHTAGAAEAVQPMAEAASDYWRMFLRRRGDFGALGEIRALVVMHARGRLTLAACGAQLLLVSLTDEPDTVDWRAWKARVGALQQAVASM
jgi:predicted regulator of Ras-like GTPase activity (Roadblock/LC7/MglB family)